MVGKRAAKTVEMMDASKASRMAVEKVEKTAVSLAVY